MEDSAGAEDWLALALRVCAASGAQGRALRGLQWQAFEVSRTRHGRALPVQASHEFEADAEVEARLSLVRPSLTALVQGVRASGDQRALRNCALHADLGCGAEGLPCCGAAAKRRQRGGRSRGQVADPSPSGSSGGSDCSSWAGGDAIRALSHQVAALGERVGRLELAAERDGLDVWLAEGDLHEVVEPASGNFGVAVVEGDGDAAAGAEEPSEQKEVEFAIEDGLVSEELRADHEVLGGFAVAEVVSEFAEFPEGVTINACLAPFAAHAAGGLRADHVVGLEPVIASSCSVDSFAVGGTATSEGIGKVIIEEVELVAPLSAEELGAVRAGVLEAAYHFHVVGAAGDGAGRAVAAGDLQRHCLGHIAEVPASGIHGDIRGKCVVRAAWADITDGPDEAAVEHVQGEHVCGGMACEGSGFALGKFAQSDGTAMFEGICVHEGAAAGSPDEPCGVPEGVLEAVQHILVAGAAGAGVGMTVAAGVLQQQCQGHIAEVPAGVTCGSADGAADVLTSSLAAADLAKAHRRTRAARKHAAAGRAVAGATSAGVVQEQLRLQCLSAHVDPDVWARKDSWFVVERTFRSIRRVPLEAGVVGRIDQVLDGSLKLVFPLMPRGFHSADSGCIQSMRMLPASPFDDPASPYFVE